MTTTDATLEDVRAKAFEQFLRTTGRQRPGEIQRLSEPGILDVEVVPTGAISLDVALGAGGFPMGRIIELYGPEMSGKCLPAGTYIWTDRGLETIEEVFARAGQAASATTRVTDISSLAIRAVNERGELEAVQALTHNYLKPVTVIKLSSGREVSGTSNHPLRVLNEGGYIVWRNIGDIREGDTIVSALFGADEAVGSGSISEDEAVLLGYLVAEGTMGETNRFQFTNFDPFVANEFAELVKQLLDYDVKSWQEGNYAVCSKELRTHMTTRYGLEVVKSAGKSIPHQIRTAGPKAQAAFLSALYEGDGWIEDGPEIGLTSASETLARQLQLLLLGLGIPSSFNVKFNKTYERNYFNVLVGPGAVHRFLNIIGFRSPRRAAQVATHLKPTFEETNAETIPNLGFLVRTLRDMIGGDRDIDRLYGDLRRPGHTNCSRSRLRNIVDWARGHDLSPAAARLVEHLAELAGSRYTYEQVIAVEDGGTQPTFDVVLPRTHSFIANGVLSHNTSLALSVAANVQRTRQGGVGFIDAEQALNLKHVRAMGVDPERLALFQPDCGEDAIRVVEEMISSDGFDMIIVDSVAALIPRDEMEKSIDDGSALGLQAKLIGTFMRRVAPLANKHNVMLVLINQLREKPGAYGNPEYTPGGRALKFWASVRIEVRAGAKANQIKDAGNKVIGQHTTAKVTKNKVGPPHTVAEYDLYFDRGIDTTGSLLDAGVKVGAIGVTNKMTYTVVSTGEVISSRGRPTAQEALQGNAQLAEQVRLAIQDALRRGEMTFEAAPDDSVETDEF